MRKLFLIFSYLYTCFMCKHKFSFILFLFLSLYAKAQDCDSLNKVVNDYYGNTEYKKALETALLEEKFCNSDTGITEKYVNALFDISILYQATGNIWKAIEYGDKAIKLYKTKFDTLQHDYLNNLNNTALMYHESGDYITTWKIYDQIVNTLKATSQVTTEYYYVIRFNVSATLGGMGLLQQENDSLLSIFENYKQNYGTNGYHYFVFVTNIIASYLKLGQYEKALALCKTEMPNIEDTSLYSLSKYPNCVNNYAAVYRSLGLYEKAISINNVLLMYWTANYKKAPISYAWTLNSLGTNYLGLKDYDKAEKYLRESASLRKDLLGENNLTYITSLFNLSTLYSQWGKYDTSLQLHKKLLSISVGNPLIEKQFIASYMNSYAELLLKMGLYDSSKYYYSKALKMRKDFFGRQHLSYVESLKGLATAYIKTWDFTKANILLTESDSIMQKLFVNTIAVLTSKDEKEFVDNNKNIFDMHFSLLANNADKRGMENSFINSIFLKSICLNETRKVLEILSHTSDTALKNIFQAWLGVKSYLSRQYTSPLIKQAQNVKEKEKQAQDLEQQLALKSAEYRRYEKGINITAKDVQDSLKENEAAIEFTSFRYYGYKGWTDSTLYAAIILTKKDTTPHWVFLFEEKQLKKMLGANASPNILYNNNKLLPHIQWLKGDKLYSLVWKKIEPYVKDIHTIYYSPSGILNAVALAAIPYSGTAMPLCKKYNLLQMSSTKNIALPPQEVPVTSIALMGGIVYDADSAGFAKQFADTTQMHSNVYTNTILSNTKSRGDDDYFTSLTATLPEVKSIAKTSEAAGLYTSIYTINAATEEQFKKISGNAPSVLHLATHGFYRSYKKPGKEDFQSTETNFSLIEDPMFRSGIALAGANLKWHKNIDVPNRDDGIVTAYEVAQMDLSKTELVVLSACKSGLGDIDGSEGVFGLQRGFKSAGVNKMIISLWNVPDKASMEFMTAFYTKWLKEKKDIRSAFYETQLMMYSKYPNAPQNWAGFVLIE